jgi:hypothetical protein
MRFAARPVALAASAVGLALALGLTACGGGAAPAISPGQSSAGQSSAGQSSAVASSAVPSSGSAATIQISDASKGSTVRARVGDQLVLVLDSTYWTVASPTPSGVLRLAGPPEQAAASGCVAGAGCGTVIAHFAVIGPGQAMITASRTSCGEALRCGADDAHFAVTVIASG